MAKFNELTEQFRKRRDEINLALDNPELAGEAIDAEVTPLNESSPTFAAKLVERSVNTTMYLKQIMPTTFEKKGPFSREILPPETQMAEWNRNYDVAYDPREYFEAVERGDVTRGMTAAFNAVWPELSGDFRTKFLERLGDEENLDMPFNAKVSLAMALGIDTDPVLDPSFVLPLQQVIAGEALADEPQPQGEGGVVKPTMTGMKQLKGIPARERTGPQLVAQQPKPWK